MSKYLLILLAPLLLTSCFSGGTKSRVIEPPITCHGSGIVSPGATLVLSYTGTKLSDDTVFDSTSAPGRSPRFMRLASGQFPVALERALLCMKVGESKTITLKPEEAYGPKMISAEFVRAAFGTGIDSLREDSDFTFPSNNTKVKILKIGDQWVTIEQPNTHPLAGENLKYEVKIDEVR